MGPLDNTDWDVVISGTGLQQSLVALALSRSGKNILHVDENPYYSDTLVALSIKEAEEWVAKVNEGGFGVAFAKASIYAPVPSGPDSPSLSRKPGREYNLALAPDIVYSNSAFRHCIVTSRVHMHLAFLPVGSWWTYSAESPNGDDTGILERVPNTREDIFGDNGRGFPTLSYPAKRKLVKILRFLLDYDSNEEKPKWESYRDLPVSAFFSAVFKAPADLLAPLLTLAMSANCPEDITTGHALPKIARHLRSANILGKFSALSPMYGGLDELCQVACRACAVGGGVYVLDHGLSSSDGSVSVVQVTTENKPSEEDGVPRNDSLAQKQPAVDDTAGPGEEFASADSKVATQAKEGKHVSRLKLHLKDGEAVTTKWVVGVGLGSSQQVGKPLCKSITIVSSSLEPLFPRIAAGVKDKEYPSGAAIIVFPAGSLSIPGQPQLQKLPPVHINAHSGDSRDCPLGQSVLYASTSLDGDSGFELLKEAVSRLLLSFESSPSPTILWSMQYEQRAAPSTKPLPLPEGADAHVLDFPPMPLDLALDDVVLDRVREVWQTIIPDGDRGQFLVFPKREGEDDDLLYDSD